MTTIGMWWRRIQTAYISTFALQPYITFLYVFILTLVTLKPLVFIHRVDDWVTHYELHDPFSWVMVPLTLIMFLLLLCDIALLVACASALLAIPIYIFHRHVYYNDEVFEKAFPRSPPGGAYKFPLILDRKLAKFYANRAYELLWGRRPWSWRLCYLAISATVWYLCPDSLNTTLLTQGYRVNCPTGVAESWIEFPCGAVFLYRETSYGVSIWLHMVIQGFIAQLIVFFYLAATHRYITIHDDDDDDA